MRARSAIDGRAGARGARAAGAALALAIASAAPARARLRNLKPGQEMPPFRLAGPGGTEITRDDPSAAATILAYVDPGRESSRRAIAALQAIHRRYGAQGLRVILAADPARPRGDYGAWAEERKIELAIHDDPQRTLYGKLGVFVLPTTIFFDRKGVLFRDITWCGADYTARADAYALRLLGRIDDRELAARLDLHSRVHPDRAAKAERHRQAALRLARKGDTDQALQELRRAAELDPASRRIREDMGDVLLQAKRYEDALAVFSELEATGSSTPRVKEGLGRAEAGLGRYEKALAHLQAALVLNPEPARVHYAIGSVYEAMGDKDRALAHYRKALERIFR